MNIAADDALARGARGFLGRGRDSALAQDDLSLGKISLGLHQGALALHDARTGPVAEFFYKLRTNLHKLASCFLGFLVPLGTGLPHAGRTMRRAYSVVPDDEVAPGSGSSEPGLLRGSDMEGKSSSDNPSDMS